MELKTITLGLLAMGASAGAYVAVNPSDFAGAFGQTHEDFVDPQTVNLNSGYIRKSISNMSVKSAFLRLARQQREKVAGFRNTSSVMEPMQGLDLLSSYTQIVDDQMVEMTVSVNGQHAATIDVIIEPITESSSAVDVQVRFNYDWLSDSGEVLPGDLARLEPAVEILATEFVLSTLQRRPFAKSDSDLEQIYGAETLQRIEDRVGKRSGSRQRIETALEAQIAQGAGGFDGSAEFPPHSSGLERRFRSIEADMVGSRHKPGEGFRNPDDEDDDSNWGSR